MLRVCFCIGHEDRIRKSWHWIRKLPLKRNFETESVPSCFRPHPLGQKFSLAVWSENPKTTEKNIKYLVFGRQLLERFKKKHLRTRQFSYIHSKVPKKHLCKINLFYFNNLSLEADSGINIIPCKSLKKFLVHFDVCFHLLRQRCTHPMHNAQVVHCNPL